MLSYGAWISLHHSCRFIDGMKQKCDDQHLSPILQSLLSHYASGFLECARSVVSETSIIGARMTAAPSQSTRVRPFVNGPRSSAQGRVTAWSNCLAVPLTASQVREHPRDYKWGMAWAHLGGSSLQWQMRERPSTGCYKWMSYACLLNFCYTLI